jgi:hypothetical protein
MGFLWGWNRSLLFERLEIEAWGTYEKIGNELMDVVMKLKNMSIPIIIIMKYKITVGIIMKEWKNPWMLMISKR